ncbi:MAG: tetratricopeptide repeat protein [Acidobacteriia bacterium]|nr:tetratricopeptide repeat protein [Terriglobia bacterium]
MRGIPSASNFVALLLLLLLLSPCSFAQTSPAKQREMQLHAARARRALDAKNPELAIREFQAILELDPRDVDARANIGVVHFLHGRCAEASEHFRKALELQPSLWKVQAMLGLCEKSSGRPDKAQALLEKSFPHLQDLKLQTHAGMALVELHYQRGNLEQALSVLDTLRKLDPANLDVLYVSYRIHSDLAVQARESIALLAPDSARMHQILAQHLINEGDAKGAVAQYREALRINPQLPGAHFELGEAILQDASSEHAQDDAQKEFAAALALNPNDAKAECKLAGILALRGDMDAALQHYTRAVELNSRESEAQIGIAKALTATGQHGKALEHLLAAVRMDPGNAGAHYRLSQLYRELGRPSEAAQELATFKELREARARIRSAYPQVYKEAGSSQTLNPDIPQ